MFGRKMSYEHERGVEKSDTGRSFLKHGPGLTGAVCRERRDAGMQWPAWDTLLVDVALMDCIFIAFW